VGPNAAPLPGQPLGLGSGLEGPNAAALRAGSRARPGCSTPALIERARVETSRLGGACCRGRKTIGGKTLVEERGKIDGDLHVADGLDLFGMVTGNLTVSAGGMAVIYGMVLGNLIVRPRGEAILQGMICGNAVNEGGTLEIQGMVVGSLDASEGTTMVADGAVIRGQEKS
jgi:hypothetical protein